jgi:hypothetical protein
MSVSQKPWNNTFRMARWLRWLLAFAAGVAFAYGAAVASIQFS